MFPGIKFNINFDAFLRQIPTTAVRAVIYNDARSALHFPYFWSVNDGRKGFGPIHAQSLMWVENGQKVFRKYVGPASAQHVREKAVDEAMPTLVMLASRYMPTRTGLVEFVNRAAIQIRLSLVRLTPRRAGRLANSYRIESAH